MGFVSEIDKQFYHQEGEVLAFELEKKVTLFKIIKIENISLRKGKVYNIAGIEIQAPDEDFFICVAVNIAKTQFDSLEEAIQALKDNRAEWVLQMSPMRPSGIYSTPILRTHQFVKVLDEEVHAFEMWKSEFLNGNAGVW